MGPVSLIDQSVDPPKFIGGSSAASPSYVATIGGAPTSGRNATFAANTQKAVTNGATTNGQGTYTQGVEVLIEVATAPVILGASGVTAANGTPRTQGQFFSYSGDPANLYALSTAVFTLSWIGN